MGQEKEPRAAEEAGAVFSAWHPAAVPKDERAPHFTASLESLAQKYDAIMLPISGMTSVAHLKENLSIYQ
jgi:aryl-alcohol dehydrogenase-like predicted oxidoreductase